MNPAGELSFESVDAARKVLELDEYASAAEIRDAFKRLAVAHHPDRAGEADRAAAEERFKALSGAQDLLLRYIERYRYSFKESAVRRCLMDAQTREYLKRYYDGLWGGKLDI